jgi:arylsulfatase A-like enzyme
VSRPNILLITTDQFRFPRFANGPDADFAEPLKQILGFQADVTADNPYAKFFPGLLRLRDNAVVLRNHTIAANACTPSRAAIYTGQYGTRTGVTQTDGLFKNGDSPDFPWLAPDGIPTLGVWLRHAGYTTHYFGKWHVSNPPDYSLEPYGFSDWEISAPEPHGALNTNLGVYRDAGFADAACAFLRRKGLGVDYSRKVADADRANPGGPSPDAQDAPPWFAVASFVNPHDIATYPGVIAQALPPQPGARPATLPTGRTLPPPTSQPVLGPLTVPRQGERSTLPQGGTMPVALNPLGFPQDCAKAPRTLDDPLANKPSCQFDYAYKMGLGLASKTGYSVARQVAPGSLEVAVAATLQNSIPFRLADKPAEASLLFLQFYAYMIALVDQHIAAVLRALDESGQAENTIVVFFGDHGEYASAHGMMMEKWHSAYQEAIHVPFVVRFPQPAGTPPVPPRQVDALTSHIDILPTVLGLAGVTDEERAAIARTLAAQRPVPPLPGVNLAPFLRGETDQILEPDGRPREAVLFITDDEITAPLPDSFDAYSKKPLAQFEVFERAVDAVRAGTPTKDAVPGLAPGAVRQPNHVRCVRTQDYKLARYFDPSGGEPQEWELYDLREDPNETTNLVQVAVTPPTPATTLPAWTNEADVQRVATELAALLARLEARHLTP